MRRSIVFSVGAILLSAVALAAGDIPSRYSGSFPSDGIRTNIVGTFTGKTLSVRFTTSTRTGTFRRTFAGSCSVSSPTQTSCTGRIQGSGSDAFDVPAVAVVTWAAGKPVTLSITK